GSKPTTTRSTGRAARCSWSPLRVHPVLMGRWWKSSSRSGPPPSFLFVFPEPPNPDAYALPATRTAVPNSGQRQTSTGVNMLTIHGVPLSVHTRKVIVTAILKKIDYRFEVVIPVIPGNPPSNWSTLSPTGLIPVMQDGDFTLADSTAICLYLDRKQPARPILPE